MQNKAFIKPLSIVLKKHLHPLRFGLLFALSWVSPNYTFGQTTYFPPTGSPQWDTISPSSLGWCQDQIDSLYQFLEDNQTKAFILLKDGKIVLENYFNGFAQNDPWYWASAGKTVTSFMTGIAQQEGYLTISDTTSDYLGQGWTSCLPTQEQKITIRNQLTMTSGLDDGVADPFCTLDTCLVYLADAGTRWAYHNGPYTLLDQVIANATGVTLNNYTNQKLLSPTGMSGVFLPNGYNNVFYSNARSMARFGLLILNRGVWNGNTIMTDTVYFNQMVNTSQNLNPSYGYLWWLNGKSGFMVPGVQFVFNGYFNTDAPADMFAALGRDGQMLNIIPSQNMIWLRMGESPSSVNVPYLLNNEIWQKINLLPCGVGVGEISQTSSTTISHSFGNVIVISNETISKIILRDLSGKTIRQCNGSNELNTVGLAAGIYTVEAYLSQGNRVIKKISILHP